MPNRWEEMEDLLVKLADAELEACGEVRPVLAAYRGDEALFLAGVRPFAKGRYEGPFIELLALAMPLDADRLALSVAGRAWSLNDPIPPVTEDADLRQRILVVHIIDDTVSPLRSVTTIYPFDVGPDGVSWGAPHDPGPGRGWIPQALEICVGGRHNVPASDREIRKQAERVIWLGHRLFLSPELEERLAFAGLR